MSYRVTGLPNFRAFGAVVEGVDLRKQVSEEVVRYIKRDLLKHRLLIFRGQGQVSGQRQVEVSEWWGPVESTFSKHPRSPHEDVFRVSNDPEEGCTHVGRSGWHIDGTFMPKPFRIQTMHFWSCPDQGGGTLFAPLKEIALSLKEDAGPGALDFDLLYFATRRRSDDALLHPILCAHPETGEDAMVFHLGRHFMDAIVEAPGGGGGGQPRVLSSEETASVVEALRSRCEDPAWCLSYDWSPGDFAIVDNLALAHYASPSTQADRRRAGLRVLHRTTVRGEHRPAKAQARPR